jgi:hypothetical protein
VQPKRGRPGAWWCNTADGAWWDMNLPDIGELDDWPCRDDWRPLRIRLLDIRQERVQEISEDDAWAEGCPWSRAMGQYNPAYEVLDPREWYANLWDSINTKPGTRWADNPEVWAITFEVV